MTSQLSLEPASADQLGTGDAHAPRIVRKKVVRKLVAGTPLTSADELTCEKVEQSQSNTRVIRRVVRRPTENQQTNSGVPTEGSQQVTETVDPTSGKRRIVIKRRVVKKKLEEQLNGAEASPPSADPNTNTAPPGGEGESQKRVVRVVRRIMKRPVDPAANRSGVVALRSNTTPTDVSVQVGEELFVYEECLARREMVLKGREEALAAERTAFEDKEHKLAQREQALERASHQAEEEARAELQRRLDELQQRERELVHREQLLAAERSTQQQHHQELERRLRAELLQAESAQLAALEQRSAALDARQRELDARERECTTCSQSSPEGNLIAAATTLPAVVAVESLHRLCRTIDPQVVQQGGPQWGSLLLSLSGLCTELAMSLLASIDQCLAVTDHGPIGGSLLAVQAKLRGLASSAPPVDSAAVAPIIDSAAPPRAGLPPPPPPPAKGPPPPPPMKQLKPPSQQPGTAPTNIAQALAAGVTLKKAATPAPAPQSEGTGGTAAGAAGGGGMSDLVEAIKKGVKLRKTEAGSDDSSKAGKRPPEGGNGGSRGAPNFMAQLKEKLKQGLVRPTGEPAAAAAKSQPTDEPKLVFALRKANSPATADSAGNRGNSSAESPASPFKVQLRTLDKSHLKP